MKEYAKKNKAKRKAYMLKYRKDNKEKCDATSRAWYYKHHEENKRKSSIANKKPEAKKRRAEAMKRFVKRNPKYMSAHSMKYYFANKDKRDKDNLKWKKVARARWGSLFKRYGLVKHTPIANALSRARGLKGEIENQDVKTIENDIKVLRNEIKRLRKEFKL